MALSSVDQSFVEQFGDQVYILAQQKGSRLRNIVTQKPFTKGESAYFERIGTVASVLRTSRHQDTAIVEVPHSRRRCFFSDFELATLFDSEDELRMIIDPRAPYQQMHAYALGRSMDDLIISAAGGNAYSGQSGATTVALPSAQKIAASATGLTLAKLLSAKQILDAADVDPDEPRYMVVSAKQINTDLLNTTEIKNADYNTVKALAEGAIDTFLGFKFIRTELVVTDSQGNDLTSGGSTFCYAWAQSGLGMILPRDVTASVDKRPDKGNSWQVMSKANFGATRIEDVKVVQIACA
jgi:hypothetical protein